MPFDKGRQPELLEEDAVTPRSTNWVPEILSWADRPAHRNMIKCPKDEKVNLVCKVLRALEDDEVWQQTQHLEAEDHQHHQGKG